MVWIAELLLASTLALWRRWTPSTSAVGR